jgi:hypothetical protein
MADQVRKVSYAYVMVPDRAGQGTKVLDQVRKAGIDMLAFSGFPAGKGKAQLDIVVDRLAPLRAIAKKNGWSLSAPKQGFHIQGPDKLGAVSRQYQKLAKQGIGVTAADAVSAGKGRYGMILWVKAKDFSRAAKALGAK